MLRRVLLGFGVFVGVIAAIIGLTVALAPWMDGPITRIAGGPFQQAADPGKPDLDKLEEAGSVELEVQLETRPSVTVAIIVHENVTYVPSTLRPAEKRWPRAILNDPAVRIRTDGKVYAYYAYKVVDQQLHQALSRLGAKKYSENYFKPENTWFFRLTEVAK